MSPRKKTSKKELAIIGNSINGINLPAKVQQRLQAKMLDKHEDRIMEMLEVRASYVKKINEIDTEIETLTSIYA